jgi:fructose-1-phosphate kinase PfkB-like protein
VAALARGLAQDLPWQEAAATAVAWSAAAVLQPVAGDVDPDDVRRLLPRVQTEEIG